MWTPTIREQHSRSELRYSTDLTDAEWTVIEPLLAAACPHGRPRLRSMREIVNGIFYVLRGGIAWRLLPMDLPPKSTVYGYFSAWRDSGLFVSINHHLVMTAQNGSAGNRGLAPPLCTAPATPNRKHRTAGTLTGVPGHDARRRVPVKTQGR